jgi:cytochrome P450
MSSAFPSFAVVALFLFSLAFAFYTYRKNRHHQSPLPPGPRKLPLIENLLDMPLEYPWIEYREMCRQYDSDIIQLSTLGMSIIVLNSAKMVSDLFEKRSRIYSNRPHSIMISELMGYFFCALFSVDKLISKSSWEKMFALRSYDEVTMAQRKILNQAFPPGDIGRFHSKLLDATHDLLRAIGRSDDLIKYLHTWAALVVLDIIYGIQGEEIEVYLPIALEALQSLNIAGSPGAFYVDQIPLLKYVPEWFPGAGFKRMAQEWNNLRIKMTETTFNVTKEQTVSNWVGPWPLH